MVYNVWAYTFVLSYDRLLLVDLIDLFVMGNAPSCIVWVFMATGSADGGGVDGVTVFGMGPLKFAVKAEANKCFGQGVVYVIRSR